MIDKPIYFAIGNLRKPFGYSGLLHYTIENEKFEEQFYKLEHFYLKIDGQYLPFFINEFVEKGDVYLHLDDVNDLQSASKISGNTIFITKDQVPKNLLKTLEKLSPLENFTVFNYGLEIGTINELIQMPTQILAYISYKGLEIGVPLVDEYIEEIDHKCKKIYMKFPDELLNL
ncbi:MAG: hypothetical protein RLZZ546_1155 [Bacteroidota bacterium]